MKGRIGSDDSLIEAKIEAKIRLKAKQKTIVAPDITSAVCVYRTDKT